MATTKNPFTPDLGQTATPTYIKNPVKDPSALAAIGGIAEELLPGTVAAYQNYRVAEDVTKPVDEALKQYEDFYQNRPDLAAGAAKEEQDNFWNNLGEVPQDTTGMNLEGDYTKADVLDKTFTQNLDKLTKAAQQGVMSESGVIAKITQIVRQAVAKNPWMEDRYYSQTQQYLKQSGIADVIDFRMKTAEDAVKRQRDLYDKAAQEMKERNLPWTPGMPYEMMVGQLNTVRQKEFNLKLLRDAKEGRTLYKDDQVSTMLETGDIEKGHQLDIERFQEDAIKEYALAKSPQEIAAINTKLGLMYRNSMMQWRQFLGGNITDPNAQKFLESVDKDYTTILETLKTAASGKEATEILQNNLKNMQSIQEMQLRSKLNTNELEMGLKILNTIPEGIRMQSMQSNANSPLNILQKQGVAMLSSAQLTNGTYGIVAPDNMGTKTLQNSAKDGSFATVFSHLAGASNNRVIQAESKQMLGRAMITFNRVIRSGMPDNDSYTFANSIIAAAAQNADNIRSHANTPLYATETTKLVDFAMNKIVSDFRDISAQLKQQHNITVTPDSLSNGVFIAYTGDPVLDDKFQTKFGQGINNALDAYASAYGKTREQAAPEFYARYFGVELRKDPDLQRLMGISTEQPSSGKQSSNVPANVAEATAQTRAAQQARDTTAANLKQEELTIVQTRIKEIDKQLNSPKVSANEKSRLAREYDELKATESALNREISFSGQPAAPQKAPAQPKQSSVSRETPVTNPAVSEGVDKAALKAKRDAALANDPMWKYTEARLAEGKKTREAIGNVVDDIVEYAMKKQYTYNNVVELIVRFLGDSVGDLIKAESEYRKRVRQKSGIKD